MSLIEVMNQSIVRSKRSRTQIALALGYKTGAPMQRILNDNDDGYSLPIERVAPFCAAGTILSRPSASSAADISSRTQI